MIASVDAVSGLAALSWASCESGVVNRPLLAYSRQSYRSWRPQTVGVQSESEIQFRGAIPFAVVSALARIVHLATSIGGAGSRLACAGPFREPVSIGTAVL